MKLVYTYIEIATYNHLFYFYFSYKLFLYTEMPKKLGKQKCFLIRMCFQNSEHIRDSSSKT